MKLKKSNLEALFNLTKGTDGVLTLPEARIRDQFIKQLEDLTNNFYQDREKIYRAYCVNLEDGTPDLKNGNQFQFTLENLPKQESEVKILNDEEVEITVPEPNPIFPGLKSILEKSTYLPKVGEAEKIDQIINSL